MTSKSTSRFDVYEAITNQIVAAIEAGAGKVQLPWHRQGASIMRPTNIASGNAYRGVNTVALWAAADALGYQHGIWGTYRQWQDRGAQVRKGEKSSLIIFYKEFESDDTTSEGNASDENQRRFMARASYVFNVAQVDGYVAPEIATPVEQIDPVDSAEKLIAATGANIRIGGEEAYFAPKADYIAMPDKSRFIGTDTSTATQGWYAILLHELTHWSGHEARLNRQFGERFGDDAYAMEEMVALSGQSAPPATLQ
ncbi:ArdC-like ssDNA-binding domain-containing protein [Sphingobium sp. DEHP117]|uniref:ArdC family protein n=1 Tax=Sphingobium sp. DEHP117 TaxID=2993436 RepID=UPI0027D57FE2|nr:ArdC-like ssDNA-binding domain-containing protein [Sphingobium sp. DEHP117]MDQ4418831.1 ArdC-like ssDNA-binding domain-containing protein [Sphingobium sp. DEHP117]